jgi:hypothetical protein
MNMNNPKTIVPPLVVRMTPLLTVTEPDAVWVKLAVIVTLPVPVVAIITVSPVAGTLPPIQVDLVDQVPPAAVLVIVAALLNETINNKLNSINTVVELIELLKNLFILI